MSEKIEGRKRSWKHVSNSKRIGSRSISFSDDSGHNEDTDSEAEIKMPLMENPNNYLVDE